LVSQDNKHFNTSGAIPTRSTIFSTTCRQPDFPVWWYVASKCCDLFRCMEEVVGAIPIRSRAATGSTAAQSGRHEADFELSARMKQNYEATAISSKMKALLAIAGRRATRWRQ